MKQELRGVKVCSVHVNIGCMCMRTGLFKYIHVLLVLVPVASTHHAPEVFTKSVATHVPARLISTGYGECGGRGEVSHILCAV